MKPFIGGNYGEMRVIGRCGVSEKACTLRGCGREELTSGHGERNPVFGNKGATERGGI